jgi:hypothetical protein
VLPGSPLTIRRMQIKVVQPVNSFEARGIEQRRGRSTEAAAPPKYPPKSDRFHLSVAYNCTCCYHVLLARTMLGLEDAITVDVVFPNRWSDEESDGRPNLWQFRPDGMKIQNGWWITTFPYFTNETVFGGQQFVIDYLRRASVTKSRSVSWSTNERKQSSKSTIKVPKSYVCCRPKCETLVGLAVMKICVSKSHACALNQTNRNAKRSSSRSIGPTQISTTDRTRRVFRVVQDTFQTGIGNTLWCTWRVGTDPNGQSILDWTDNIWGRPSVVPNFIQRWSCVR